MSSKRRRWRGIFPPILPDKWAIEGVDKERLYAPLLICNETGYPPAIQFRKSSSRRIPCTITIDDPTFHLFQAYLHLDVPLVCRLPSSGSTGGSWAQIPVSLVGKAELSHIDLEPKINFIFHYDRTRGLIEGGAGYSIGPTATSQTEEHNLGWLRLKIGDQVQFELSVRYT